MTTTTGASVSGGELDSAAAGVEQPTARRTPRSFVLGLVRTARPRQWVKNVLVFSAPGAAGVLTHPRALGQTLLCFAVFSMAASGTYFVNDAADRRADRLHPRKRHRPVAAGIVPVPVAVACGVLLIAAAIGVSAALTLFGLATSLGVYAAITISYTLWLKEEPVLDLAAVAAGFILRAIAGGLATGVLISNWFLIVVSFGSLFMVAGKRHGEHLALGDDRALHRAVLHHYSVSFLHYVRGTCSAVAIAAYALWSFERAGGGHSGLAWPELSIVPFVLGIFRYALLVEAGQGSAPEDIVLGDRTLQLIGVAWVITFALGVYVH